MLDVSILTRLLGDGDWVTVAGSGEPIQIEIPKDIGPATLLVRPVTDAMKTVSDTGLVQESLDREKAWEVAGFALNRVVIQRLGEGVMTGVQLHEAVIGMGLLWQSSTLPPVR